MYRFRETTRIVSVLPQFHGQRKQIVAIECLKYLDINIELRNSKNNYYSSKIACRSKTHSKESMAHFNSTNHKQNNGTNLFTINFTII
jgi:hypothetical protein